MYLGENNIQKNLNFWDGVGVGWGQEITESTIGELTFGEIQKR